MAHRFEPGTLFRWSVSPALLVIDTGRETLYCTKNDLIVVISPADTKFGLLRYKVLCIHGVGIAYEDALVLHAENLSETQPERK